ncbi:MAG: hypothetical protein AAFQ82_27985 [Myxococcota bacterium]
MPPAKLTQISAPVSPATKKRLDEHVARTGMKKGRVIEDALLHHLNALLELPDDVIIPPRIVLTKESFDRVVDLIENPRKPNSELRELLLRDD